MPVPPEFPLSVFYDGSCSVCATEMEAYMRKEHGGRLLFVDISAPSFDPTPYGITLDAFMYQMHAIDRTGRVYLSVEAFWAIWQAFPASTLYGFLGALVMLPGVNLLARAGYRGFARIRKYLPRRRETCAGGSCRIGQREE
ncbi:putative thiol-disulfide oxidoreductase DCC [Geobacter metallireducens RCH3]|uniref:Thiol-disulfide oxidoreductase n=1 Tax=Geobacter metallireducens (strain ATCC 53774 / DSM 7210 / GS-15) TaxID=269799 RepID=Q39Z97_GEOMG|nr:DUF393 domain-containing protein [Geobacter metallireducens]ABB30427.1 protein of unknown function DUF393 [Geobacter metallireducens GS-15]EHP87302.1 putative thiol-disulfide oxidoreductase DCC [Geobacter metallireducens RCH3]